ncbi:hypothetical protein ACH4UM_39715 [Streptomyces sp. NPDC020801]
MGGSELGHVAACLGDDDLSPEAADPGDSVGSEMQPITRNVFAGIRRT